MSGPTGERKGQLDMPLVWEVEPAAPVQRPPAPEPGPQRPAPAAADGGRMLLAAVADLGLVALLVAVAWLVLFAAGADSGAVQLGLGAAVGVEAVSLAALGALWGWRGSPGMLLLGCSFTEPLSAGAAARVWFLWLACLGVGGVPLLVGAPGRRPMEKVAGSPLRRALPSAGA